MTLSAIFSACRAKRARREVEREEVVGESPVRYQRKGTMCKRNIKQ